MNWTQDQVFALIDEFRESPMLWDKNDKCYGNNKTRNDAWIAIHQKLNFHSKEEIKRKMMNLLTVFKREKKKRRKIITNANGMLEVAYDSAWYAFERMSFLLPIKTKPVWNSGMRGGVLVDADEVVGNNDVKCSASEDDEIEFSTNMDDEEYTISTEIAPENGQKRKHSTDCDSYTYEKGSSHDPLHPKRNSGPKDDSMIVSSSSTSIECTAFGNYVGTKLQNYPQKTKNVIQYHINNIFFKADLGMYDCIDKKVVKKQKLSSDFSSSM